MLSLDGIGYPPVREPPFEGKPESYRDLARLMCGDFVSFATTGDPNSWRSEGPTHGEPAWPAYSIGTAFNFVYDANVTSFVEADTWRAEGIDLINAHNLDVYDR
jgi:acetylcholinesterase